MCSIIEFVTSNKAFASELAWWDWLRKYTKRHSLYSDVGAVIGNPARRINNNNNNNKGKEQGDHLFEGHGDAVYDDKENGMRVEFLNGKTSSSTNETGRNGSLWAIEDETRGAQE